MYHKDVQTYFRWCRLIYVHSIDHRKDLKLHTIGSCTGPCPFLTGHYGWEGMLGNTHTAYNNYMLQLHIQAVHDGVRYPCNLCNHTASYRSNLRRHIDMKHRGLRYQCPHCSSKTSTKQNLQKHIKSMHKPITTLKVSLWNKMKCANYQLNFFCCPAAL